MAPILRPLLPYPPLKWLTMKWDKNVAYVLDLRQAAEAHSEKNHSEWLKWPPAVRTCSYTCVCNATHTHTHTHKWREIVIARLCFAFGAEMEILLMRAITMSVRKCRPEQNNNTDGSLDNNKDSPKCSWLWTPCWLCLCEEMTLCPSPCYL